MKQIAILGLALVLGFAPEALAQAKPDFSGTWKLNQAKSSAGVAGNTPKIAFPSQLVVKQSPSELVVQATSVRQAGSEANYKLDGSKVSIEAPEGITETGEAKFDGSKVVIMSQRSFSSPAGDQIVNFKELWSVDGQVLTIEKTRIEDGEVQTEKGVYDKAS
jgi:hypothetical protein